MISIHRLTAILATAILATAPAPAHAQPVVEWITLYGSTGTDNGRSVTVDAAGKIWVAGETFGNLGGTHAGGGDIFLSRLSPNGSMDFTRQRGGTGEDLAKGVAVVGTDTVFAGGTTRSSTIDARPSLGSGDNLAVRYNAAGTWTGTTRFGTSGWDSVEGVAGNASNLLLAGHTEGSFEGQTNAGNLDAFLSKRDSTGVVVWTRFVETSEVDTGAAATFDNAGNAYVAGSTNGSLSGFINAGLQDLFVARYDSGGTRTLLTQIGGIGDDYLEAMTVDASGNIYLTGMTSGVLGGQANAGGSDAFVMKLDNTGNVLWSQLLGGPREDLSRGVGVDGAGHVWIGGSSDSALGGRPATGVYDAFVSEFDSDGRLLGTTFLAVSNGLVEGLDIGPDDGVYVAGFGYKAGTRDDDVFVAKLTSVPKPSQVPALLNPRRSEVNGTASFHFDLLGEAGRTYQLQSSPSLTGWINLNTVTSPGPLLPVVINIPPGQPQQFYRAVPQ